jgi:hypothetical protein
MSRITCTGKAESVTGGRSILIRYDFNGWNGVARARRNLREIVRGTINGVNKVWSKHRKSGAAKQFAERVENYTSMEWNSRRAMEKIPTSQAFKINSGFLTSFGMTPEGIFPQTVNPAPTLKRARLPDGKRRDANTAKAGPYIGVNLLTAGAFQL